MYFQTDELIKLPREKQIYFAAICVERVVPVFEFNYDETIQEPRNIIANLIHSWVSADIDLPRITWQKAKLKTLIPDVDVMGSEFTSSMLAGTAMLYLCDAIISNKVEDIVYAIEYSLQAVDSFSEYDESGVAEEQSWQKQALDIIESSEGYPVEAIKIINEDYPEWSAMWRD